MIDNLAEAIAHERKEAENYTITSNALYEEYYKISLNCQELANYHEQLASWLEELKTRREADNEGETEDAFWRRIIKKESEDK